jgi:hypothetical protein
VGAPQIVGQDSGPAAGVYAGLFRGLLGGGDFPFIKSDFRVRIEIDLLCAQVHNQVHNEVGASQGRAQLSYGLANVDIDPHRHFRLRPVGFLPLVVDLGGIRLLAAAAGPLRLWNSLREQLPSQPGQPASHPAPASLATHACPGRSLRACHSAFLADPGMQPRRYRPALLSTLAGQDGQVRACASGAVWPVS